VEEAATVIAEHPRLVVLAMERVKFFQAIMLIIYRPIMLKRGAVFAKKAWNPVTTKLV